MEPNSGKKKTKHIALRIVLILLLLVAVVLGGVFLWGNLQKQSAYAEAHSHLEAGRYSTAEKAFRELDGYRDSAEMVTKTCYLHAQSLLEKGEYDEARDIFLKLQDYADSAEMVQECSYREALEQMEKGNLQEAVTQFQKLGDYRDSETYAAQCSEALNEDAYRQAVALMEREDYAAAAELFTDAGGYRDADDLAQECVYLQAVALMEQKEYAAAAELFSALSGFRDADALAEECRFLSTTEGRTRRNFEGKWIWVNPAAINPYDRYYDIDFDTHTITFFFQSSTTHFEKVFDFEVLNETTLRANGFRDSGDVTIRLVDHRIHLEYSAYSNAPSSNKENLYLVRIDGNGAAQSPQQEITLEYSDEPRYYPNTEFLTFDSCIAGRSPISESNENGVIHTYYHYEPYNGEMSKNVNAYKLAYLQEHFAVEQFLIRDYPGSTSYWTYDVYFDRLGNALYITSGMNGSLTKSFAKAHVIPADHMEEFYTEYVVK